MTEAEHASPEREHHKKALELYVSLGDKRTYRQVATQMGVALPTIKRWAKAFRWQERVSEREAQMARQIADRTLDTRLDDAKSKRKIVRAALVLIAKMIASGKMPTRMSDLDRLIRLDGLLSGHPDGVESVPRSARTVEEFKEYIEYTPIYIKEKYRAVIEEENRKWEVEQEEKARRHAEIVAEIEEQKREREAGGA